MQNKLYGACIDCGSTAEHIMVDEVKPMYREEIFHYSCGAVLRSISASRGRKGIVTHEGCPSEKLPVTLQARIDI